MAETQRPLVVRTVEVPDPGPLLDRIPASDAFVWLHHGEGLVGWGEAARCPSPSLAGADRWWSGVVDRAVTVDELADRPPGAGLVAFGSFVFDPAHTAHSSSLVVPRTVLGVRAGRAWLTTVGTEPSGDPTLPDPVSPRTPTIVSLTDGALSADQWGRRVTEAVRRISAGQLEKVVLAREIVAEAEQELDPRWLLRRLAERYARCRTFQVDGLIGASPELLLRRQDGRVISRVLAGTVGRGGTGLPELELQESLMRSGKERGEHALAVRSVARALAPLCLALNVPESPFVLDLPNLLHLATEVTGVVRSEVSAFGLVAALHPSASVCGTPTTVARSTIVELEQLDRGRYLGPVGWVDARGDGEWAIALRCGQIQPTDRRRIRLYAGCGIVSGSQAAQELAETEAKLLPMRWALDAA